MRVAPAWKGLKETREKKSIFFNFTNLLNHREVIAYSVLSFGEDHKVRVAPLRFILYFGRGPPLQAEVQGSELYDGKLSRMVLRAGTKR